MTDLKQNDIEEIRNKKAKELLAQHHNQELPPQTLPWSFKTNPATGYSEIFQNENMVAITLDPKWSHLVCDLLNSLTIAQQTGELNNEV